MKTNELINLLSSVTEPTRRDAIPRSVLFVVIVSFLIVALISGTTLGLREDLFNPPAAYTLFGKFAYAASIVSVGGVLLCRLASPGGESRASLRIAVLPFVGIVAVASLVLVWTPLDHWYHSIVGDNWLICIVSIPLIAIVPLTMIFWVLRRYAAPTNLVKAGAYAGLTAGGLAAFGYALHCADDSLPFVAGWYVGAVILTVLVGAVLGPRYLKW